MSCYPQDLVNLKLDQHRNQLITVDLLLTAFTAACAMISVVSGIFGMNLNSELQVRSRSKSVPLMRVILAYAPHPCAEAMRNNRSKHGRRTHVVTVASVGGGSVHCGAYAGRSEIFATSLL